MRGGHHDRTMGKVIKYVCIIDVRYDRTHHNKIPFIKPWIVCQTIDYGPNHALDYCCTVVRTWVKTWTPLSDGRHGF